QPHVSQPQSTKLCPISPALPFTPRSSFPSIITPPPIPVLTVIYVKLSHSVAAPIHFSASAATLASFSKRIGYENDCANCSQIGTSTHPVKLGGHVTIPFLLSNGPGAPIPMPIISVSSICT